jgi:hypothetical protein
LSVVVDTSFVVELYDRRAARWPEVDRWNSLSDEVLFTTPLAVSEMDHVVPRRGGKLGRQALWRNLEAGALTVRWWADAMDETIAIARKRPGIGLVDASLVALANRLRTDRIATLDDHFRTLKTQSGKPFTILPADA